MSGKTREKAPGAVERLAMDFRRPNGTFAPSGKSIIELFWERVPDGDFLGCWPWKGQRSAAGYGYIRGECAHRISYELHKGLIPSGLSVLHKCDNPPCVNPQHLFLGTHADNMGDMKAKGRHSRAKNTHCINGHQFNAENTWFYKAKRQCKICHQASRVRRRLALQGGAK